MKPEIIFRQVERVPLSWFSLLEKAGLDEKVLLIGADGSLITLECFREYDRVRVAYARRFPIANGAGPSEETLSVMESLVQSELNRITAIGCRVHVVSPYEPTHKIIAALEIIAKRSGYVVTRPPPAETE